MNNKYLAVFLAVFATVGIPNLSYAGHNNAKPWLYGWVEHDYNEASIIPEKSGAKHYHPDQWVKKPEMINFKQREQIINQAKEYKYINAMMASEEVATVYTGPYFKELAFPDKQFLMRVIATHYEILDTKYRMFTIRDGKSKDFLGTYTRNGLELE